MVDGVRDHEAHSKIDAHEKVCVERYGNIWEALKEIKSALQAERIERATAGKVIHDRFNTISNRMWAALATVAVSAATACAVVVFYIMTRGKI